MPKFSIRPAQHGDEAAMLGLLRGLAEYEKLLDKFNIDEAVIRRDYLAERSPAHCDLAFEGETPAGIATWYWAYASFAAKRVLYLEDLFVSPQFRGRGYGKALLAHLAKTAVAAGAARMSWQVLPWNTPSIEFYESLGAEKLVEWLVFDLSGDALKRLSA